MTVSRSALPRRSALLRRTALVAAAVGASLALAACGSGGGGHTSHNAATAVATATASPSATGTGTAVATGTATANAPAPAGAHNAADTAFAQQMIPHHRQAVAMAELAAGRASSEQVKQLAAKIKGAQDPEIATMTGWLTAWGEQVPAADADAHAGHGGGSMPGMMTQAEMDRLTKASGAAFDKAFLTMMIAHHEGAVTMAATEKAQGAYTPAKELAEAIATAQTAEITLMKQLLAG